MKRTYIKDLGQSVGQEVSISGWVDVRRDQGKMVFMDIRDMSGKVQCVVLPSHTEPLEVVKEVRTEWVLQVNGVINKRPEKNVKAGVQNGDIELEITKIQVLSKATELPFEKDTELNLDTYLDYLPLTLKSERSRDIFKVQETIIQAFREALKMENFTEFQAPAIVGGDAEGGAMAFKVDYYYDKSAFLATSPQFYKQIMAGVYERVFTTPKIFRGEKHATTRHLSELTQMDFEMAFIKDEKDVMEVLEKVIKHIVKKVSKNHPEVFAKFKTEIPLIPEKFPILTLREAQKVLGVKEEPDLDPEQERSICEWAKKEHGSDFVFITHFPTAKRAFYTYEEPSEAPYSRGFDLLFRGLEINSGSQRIHDYDTMIEKMKARGLDPEKFSFYLQCFKYGIPPHGGCSTGLERITARMLDLSNVKEAALFPRDLNRIDNRLSQ
ncbi:MAG: aspartate--tRNA(Asn) ligase [Minisyncoccia bacterium]